MHSPLCRHATGEPRAYAAEALKLGLTEIGFSDHSPMRQDDFDDWRMRFDQLGAYVEQVRQAQREHPGLAIRLALEIDYLPGQEAWIRELAARHPWDYLIGSVHYVTDHWAVDNPAQVSLWQERDVFEVWALYFERLVQAVESGLFDIIGHADLPKKFGHLPAADLAPLFKRFLAAARRRGVAVELSTGGLRKDCREIYPAPRWVRLMRQAGLPITFGSDAHAPEEVGFQFAEAVRIARAAGYTHWRRFEGRRHTDVPLE